MKKNLIIIFFLIFGFIPSAYSQKHSDNLVDSLEEQMHIEDLIARFSNDADKTMKCETALAAFKKEFDQNPKNPYVALYLGRAYDYLASFGDCEVAENIFLSYTDSAIYYFRLGNKLQPGIRESKFEFSVPELIGHVYGTRCLWRLKHGDYENARKELAFGRKEHGFSPAQIEICRLMLDFCDTGSIFFSTGDDDTFPIMYLQMVEGYRTDITVINISLANLKWYFKLFLTKGKKGFEPIETTLSQKELDSLEEMDTKQSVPNRIYTDIDLSARTRIHEELGIDVADKAEICFPVYKKAYNIYYAYGAQKVIAFILTVNKWKRRIYFGAGGLDEYLNCTNVTVREGKIANELYPIDSAQVAHFMKDGRWFHKRKLEYILLHDAQMEKFSEEQVCTVAQQLLYSSLWEFLYACDSTYKSKIDIIRKIQNIPHKCLENLEESILGCAREMFLAGYKEEAKKECDYLLSCFEKKVNGAKTSLGQDESNYIIALIISGNCSKATEFVNSFEITQEIKDATLSQMREFYGCK
jgi:hypothetical protein